MIRFNRTAVPAVDQIDPRKRKPTAVEYNFLFLRFTRVWYPYSRYCSSWSRVSVMVRTLPYFTLFALHAGSIFFGRVPLASFTLFYWQRFAMLHAAWGNSRRLQEFLFFHLVSFFFCAWLRVHEERMKMTNRTPQLFRALRVDSEGYSKPSSKNKKRKCCSFIVSNLPNPQLFFFQYGPRRVTCFCAFCELCPCQIKNDGTRDIGSTSIADAHYLASLPYVPARYVSFFGSYWSAHAPNTYYYGGP